MPRGKPKIPEPHGRIITYSNAAFGQKWVAPPSADDQDFQAFYTLYKRRPIVHAAIDIQVDHCMASEYTLEPENEEWVDAVNLYERLRETFYGLLIYGNWLIELTYDTPYREGFPGIIGIPPQLMQPHGIGNKIEYWTERNKWAGVEQKFKPDDDIVHIHTDIMDGDKWGPGLIRSVYTPLEMKASMENLHYNIVGQFAQPIHVFMVPKDAKNPPSRADMEQLLKDFDDMTEEEIRAMTINKNLEIQIIGSDRNIPDFSWFMEHNDTQVYAGLGVYPVLMERGQNATEATSKTQFAAFNRRTVARHRLVENFFNRKILSKLMPPSTIKFEPPVEPSFNVPAMQKPEGGQSEQQGGSSPERNPAIQAR